MCTGLRLLALGGGGATHGLDSDIDGFAFRLVNRQPLRVGWVGWARQTMVPSATSVSTDGPVAGRSHAAEGVPSPREAPETAFDPRLAMLRQQLRGRVQGIDTLACTAGVKQAERWCRQVDLVYVGGGNTAALLHALRDLPAGRVLVAAVRQGLPVVGVSAGASVWFECALSDAGGRGLHRLDGLGLVPGSFCPHYDSEPLRRDVLEREVGCGAMPPGMALDDGMAVLFSESGPIGACRGRLGARAWRVSRGGLSESWPESG